jgi:8-amino-7-oxononanoate synthase
LIQAGFEVKPKDGRAAIVSILINDDNLGFAFWKKLFDEGVFANVFIPPASPPNQAMMRNSFMTTHTNEHLDFIIEKYIKVGKEMGFIS